MNPEWIHVALTATAVVVTISLYVLKRRDSATAEKIETTNSTTATKIENAILKMKSELWERLDLYVPKTESDTMHAENTRRLDHIQSQLDTQGGKLDVQGKAIGDIQSKLTTMEKQGRRKAA